ncbi:hypothetical protein FOZ62_007874, partial [Perkinsus olseni]
DFLQPDSPWYMEDLREGLDCEERRVSSIDKFSGGEGEQPSDYDSTKGSQEDVKGTLPKNYGEFLEDEGQRGQRGQRQDAIESEDIVDNKPPWEVLERRWLHDDKAVLGRVMISTPWMGEERPDMNYRYAAKRGAHSVERLNKVQKEAFEKALDQYVARGFCGIVKNNKEDNYGKLPTATECQAEVLQLLEDINARGFGSTI